MDTLENECTITMTKSTSKTKQNSSVNNHDDHVHNDQGYSLPTSTFELESMTETILRHKVSENKIARELVFMLTNTKDNELEYVSKLQNSKKILQSKKDSTISHFNVHIIEHKSNK